MTEQIEEELGITLGIRLSKHSQEFVPGHNNYTSFFKEDEADELPGKPNLINVTRRIVIFTYCCSPHGCTQHTIVLSSKLEFLEPEVRVTALRDLKIRKHLTEKGWLVLNVWECQLKNEKEFDKAVKRILYHAVSRISYSI